MAKYPMPKTRAEFERAMTNAFISGCHHGYRVEHTVNVQEQENLGAEHLLGRISKEEFYEKWEILKTEH